ncbi:MAG TPA: endosialidase [Clostridiales bacterium]|nr:endosialidase [Clostridiales bacterium]
MSIVNELIRKEEDGSISFGNYKLEEKSKVEDFEHEGDMYKVKTFRGITKLERNGSFVYESVPGTAVENFKFSDRELTFGVQGYEDTQVTLELEPDKKYKVFINDINIGKIKTNLGGKIVLNVEFTNESKSDIRIKKLK